MAKRAATPMKYTEPHERKSGPWDDYELEEAGRHIDRAEKIKANPKLVEAVAKHHEGRAKEHREISSKMKRHMRRGLISEKALAKVSSRKRN